MLPSAHSNTAIITFRELIFIFLWLSEVTNIFNTAIPQLTSPILTLTTSAIIVKWTAPQYIPDSYIVSKSCQLLCDTTILSESQKEIDETNYTIFLVDPGSYCTVSLVALFGSNSSTVVTSSVNTTSAGIVLNVIPYLIKSFLFQPLLVLLKYLMLHSWRASH